MSGLQIAISGNWLDDLIRDLMVSDRACAVLGGAILDDRVLSLLQKFLLPPEDENRDQLFRDGAGESFASRIELARRLGLINEITGACLDWVRRIRNDAAHQAEFSFDANAIRDNVDNVVRKLRLQERAPAVLEAPYDSAKGRFVLAVALLIGELGAETEHTTRTQRARLTEVQRVTLTRKP